MVPLGDSCGVVWNLYKYRIFSLRWYFLLCSYFQFHVQSAYGFWSSYVRGCFFIAFASSSVESLEVFLSVEVDGG